MDHNLLNSLLEQAKTKEAKEAKDEEERRRYWNELKAKEEAERKKQMEDEWPTRISAAPTIFEWITEFMKTELATYLFSKQDTIRLYEEPGTERTNWDYISLSKDGSLWWHYMRWPQNYSVQFKTVDDLARGLPVSKLCVFCLYFSNVMNSEGRGIYARMKYNAENVGKPGSWTY